MGVSCKEKIIGQKHLLTNTEKKIAEYVLDNYEGMLNSNITELAEHVGVSDASVVRFCKSLGYKGYQDFKISAARNVLPKGEYSDLSLKRSDDSETICRKIFNSEIIALNRTLAGLKMEEVQRAVTLIGRAGKVVMFGNGGSLLVAKDAQHKLMRIGIQVYVYEEAEMQMMSSSLMEKGDVAVCISDSGSSCNVLKCMENAQRNGATAIAIVGRGRTPIAKAADIALYATLEENRFQSVSAGTRIAQLCILDVLATMLAFDNYDETYWTLKKTHRASSENRI